MSTRQAGEASNNNNNNNNNNSGSINITQLPLEQLEGLRKQLHLDVNNLTAAYESLRTAHGRFISNREVLQEYEKVCTAARNNNNNNDNNNNDNNNNNDDNDNKQPEALVCISSALYAVGRIIPSPRVLVDVGTDYFLEQPITSAAGYFHSRAESVRGGMEALEAQLRGKQRQLTQVVETMRARQQQEMASA